MNAAKLIAFSIGTAIVLTFGLTLYSLYLDRTASATVAGAFTLALVLFKHLPIIESFEVLSLKAKFIHRISEFDRLLEHIRRNASVSSKLLYWQLAYGDRMTSMPWHQKRDFADEFDSMLASLNVDAEVVSAYKEPLLHLMSLDLFRVLERSAAVALRKHRSEAERAVSEYSRGRAIATDDPEWNRLLANQNNYVMPFATTQDTLDGQLVDMKSITSKLMAGVNLPAAEKEQLQIIRDEVVALANECRKSGTITQKTAVYLEKYAQGEGKRWAELIGNAE